MTDEWRLRELVESILETHSTAEEACIGCPELLPKVRERLERIRRVEQQIDQLFPGSPSVPQGRGERLERYSATYLPDIDGYDVEGILGRGGMGVVYKARHQRLNRVVALKMLLAGPYASPQEVARFVRESRAVAELQHPHIVQVHDVGDLDGRPYFTMEFVEGGSLAQYLAGMPQPSRRAAELTAALARAIQVAHSKGIIHRDLKPANILLADTETPKIADFGLARYVDGDPGLTMSDARVGTPSYMSPEQALGRLGVIGPSVDIYALGAILYEMLTGRPPFRAETAIETERQVVTAEVVRPSRLNSNVPRDLETICLKCLQKDPAQRYINARELADDIQRFLDGQPVRARPVGWMYRLWRWGSRNRAVAAAFAGISLLLALIFVGSLWAAAHFRRLEGEQRILAEQKGDLAEQKGQLVIEKEREREKAVVAERLQVGLRRKSEAQSQELRRNLYSTEMNLAGQAAILPSGLGRVSELLTPWKEERTDLRNWEWYYLNGLCHRSLSTYIGHLGAIHNVAWSPDGTRLASVSSDRTIVIWDVAEERPLLRLVGHQLEVLGVTWSPNGKHLASASWDHTVRVWDVTTAKETVVFKGHTEEVFAVAWSPDGSQIASGGRDRKICVWDVGDGTIRQVLDGHESTVTSLDWHPNGQRMVSGARDNSVRMWDVAGQQELQKLVGHGNWVNDVDWSADGVSLASASNDQTVRIWNAETGQELRCLHGHVQGVASVAWSPDSTRLISSSDDQTIKVWSAANGTESFTLRGHTAPLTTVAWNPSGDRIASAGYDRTIRLWDASAGPETPILAGHESSITALAWCQQDSRLCASADSAGLIKVWDIHRSEERWTWRGDQNPVHALAWHPAGTRLAATSGNGTIRIWNVISKDAPQILEGHSGVVSGVSWNPDGRRLASAGYDRTIRVWDAASGKVLRTIDNHQHHVYCVAWSPDGKRLASASGDRTVKLWDVDTGNELLCYHGHPSEAVTVAWSPDGTMLVSAGFDHSVHLWSATTARQTSLLRGHTTNVVQVVWNPDGTRLASTGRDGAIKVFDAATGREALTLATHTRHVNALAWSPDGMTLVSAGDDQQIQIHDATPGYVAARDHRSLPVIDRQLARDAAQPSAWRIRAEIYARSQNWNQVAAELRQYLLLKPTPSWCMLDGLVAGPDVEDMNVRGLPESIDFFSTPAPLGDEISPTARVPWKTIPCSAQGLIDFGKLWDRKEHISGYAFFPIYSLEDQSVAILLGTDDQARLWVNGELIYESSRARQAVPDEDAVAATLKAGWNSLLIRVANETADHALFLRLSDAPADISRTRRMAE